MTGLRLISDIIKSSGYVPENENGGNRQAELPDSKAQLASIATYGVNYRGDTRGQEWYMDMMCEARGADDLKIQSTLQKVQI